MRELLGVLRKGMGRRKPALQRIHPLMATREDAFQKGMKKV